MRVPKLKPLDPVLVDAVDLTTHQSWHTIDHADSADCMKVRAIGLYVRHDKEVIRIAQMFSHDGKEADGMTETLVLPLGVVKRVRKFK